MDGSECDEVDDAGLVISLGGYGVEYGVGYEVRYGAGYRVGYGPRVNSGEKPCVPFTTIPLYQYTTMPLYHYATILPHLGLNAGLRRRNRFTRRLCYYTNLKLYQYTAIQGLDAGLQERYASWLNRFTLATGFSCALNQTLFTSPPTPHPEHTSSHPVHTPIKVWTPVSKSGTRTGGSASTSRRVPTSGKTRSRLCWKRNARGSWTRSPSSIWTTRRIR